MFGIDTDKAKAAFKQFEKDAAALQSQPTDPALQIVFRLISALAKAFVQ